MSFLTHGQEKYGEPPQELGSQAGCGTNGCKYARQHNPSGGIPIAIVLCECRSVHEKKNETEDAAHSITTVLFFNVFNEIRKIAADG